jgi:hypothetical protein
VAVFGTILVTRCVPRPAPRLGSALVLLAVGACDARADSAPAVREASLARGDRVVVEERAAQFVEAQLLEVTPSTLRVQTIEGARTLTIGAADAYPIPGSAPLAAGFAACKVGAEWAACRVAKLGPAVDVELSDATRARLSDEQVLRVSELTRLNVEKRFDQARRRADFERALAGAGHPQAPRDWHPAGRERVVARRGGGWFSAAVHELEADGSLRVRYRADASEASLMREDVVPEPPHPGSIERDAFALMRPDSTARAWVPVRVTRAADDRVSVVDIDGESAARRRHDLIPLRKVAPR